MLVKGEEKQISHEFDAKRLEEILIEFKGGKTTLGQAALEILTLHEATARFASLKHTEVLIDMQDKHLDMYNMAVMQQHDDFVELTKALKDVVKKK